MKEDVLPEGWEIKKLESLADILDSQRKPINSKEREKRIQGKSDNKLFPYYGATGEVGKIDDYLFDEELVALGEDGVPFLDFNKDKAYMLYGKTWVNNHAHVLRAKKGITENKFLYYFLNQFDFRYLSRTLNFFFSSKNLLLPLDLRTIFHKDMVYLHPKARISCSLQNLKISAISH